MEVPPGPKNGILSYPPTINSWGPKPWYAERDGDPPRLARYSTQDVDIVLVLLLPRQKASFLLLVTTLSMN